MSLRLNQNARTFLYENSANYKTKNPELKNRSGFFYDNMVLCYSTCPN